MQGWWAYGLPALLFFFALLIYSPALDVERFYSWDDNRYLDENQLIRELSPSGLWDMFSQPYFAAYIPVTLLSYAIDYQLWGLDERGGYMFTNLLLHAANGVMVYWLVWYLQKNRWLALLVALLFIAHPVQVESVAWIGQRKSVLCMFFYLIAWLLHIQSAQRQGRVTWLWVAMGWLAFLLSVLSKPSVVFAPILFMFYDYYWTKIKFPSLVLRSLPYWAIGITGAILIYWAHDEYGGIKSPPGSTPLQSFGIMSWVFWDYAESLLYPLHLNNMYVYMRADIVVSNPQIWLGIFLLTGMTVYGFLDPLRRPSGLFSMVWVGVMMLPVSNIVPIAIQRADRYMYFPSIVVFMLFGLLLAWVWDRFRQVEVNYVLVGIASAAVVACTVLTIERTDIWRNEDVLWEDHLKDYPRSETGLLNRGVHFFNQGPEGFPQAAVLFTELVENYPFHFKGNRFMGIIRETDEDWEAASRYYATALAVQPNNPEIQRRLGVALLQLGLAAFDAENYPQALELYGQAARFIPNEPRLYNNIGFTYYSLRQLPEAIAAYQQAISLDSAYGRAWVNLGDALIETENFPDSYTAYNAAINVNHPLSNNALSNRCLAGAEIGAAAAEVLPSCEQALQNDPDNAFFWGRTAHVFLLYGDAARALEASQAAIERNPNLALAYRTLGDAQAALGNPSAAIEAYNRSLSLDPNNQAAQNGLAVLTN
jgi:tetratricopeptide (TPR) repeat protein